MFTVCIDPGIGGTGYAVFRNLQRKWKKTRRPLKTGMVPPPDKDHRVSWQHKVVWYSNQLRIELCNYNLTNAYIEMPEFWTRSAKSYASTKQGNLFKLAYLVGAIGDMLYMHHSIIPELLAPSKWKGQLSKSVVDKRIRRAIGKNYPEHVSDAVGIGLSVQGKL